MDLTIMVPQDVMALVREEVESGRMQPVALVKTEVAATPISKPQLAQKAAQELVEPTPLDLESQFPEPVRTEWKILARFRIHSPEVKIPEIAERIGVNAQTVRNWIRNPNYQRFENFLLNNLLGNPVALLPRSKQEVVEKFGEFSGEMQDRLYDIISTTKNERLQAQLVKDWLAYSGHRIQDSGQKGSFNLVITAEVMQDFLNRAKEAGLHQNVIDGSTVE